MYIIVRYECTNGFSPYVYSARATKRATGAKIGVWILIAIWVAVAMTLPRDPDTGVFWVILNYDYLYTRMNWSSFLLVR